MADLILEVNKKDVSNKKKHFRSIGTKFYQIDY